MKVTSALIVCFSLCFHVVIGSILRPRGRWFDHKSLAKRTWDKDGNEIGPFPISSSSSVSLPVTTITIATNKDKDPRSSTTSVIASVSTLPDKNKMHSSSDTYSTATRSTMDKDRATSSSRMVSVTSTIHDKDRTVLSTHTIYSTIIHANSDKSSASSSSDPGKDRTRSISSMTSSTSSIVSDPDKVKDKSTSMSRPMLTVTMSPSMLGKDRTSSSISTDPDKDKPMSTMTSARVGSTRSSIMDPNKDKTSTFITMTIPASTEIITVTGNSISTPVTITRTVPAYVIVTVYHFSTTTTTTGRPTRTILLGTGMTLISSALPTSFSDKDKNGTTSSHPIYYPTYAKDKPEPSSSSSLPHIQYYTPSPWPNPTSMPMWEPADMGHAYGGGWACVPMKYVADDKYDDKDKHTSGVISSLTYRPSGHFRPTGNVTLTKPTLKPRILEMRNSAVQSTAHVASLAAIGILLAAVLL